MKIGKVEREINEMLEEKGALMFLLIDPVDYESEDAAVKAGREAIENGADCLLIGGSTGAQGELLETVTKRVKEETHGAKPIILFPGNIATITRYADAIYFMSLLNARNPYWLIQAQLLSAPVIKQMGIEPLPVGYIVVVPGGTVGWVGDANLVPREKPKIAASLALAGEFLGNRFIVTDTGSNPRLQGYGPVPPEMIKAVKSVIDVPYIVAGGILTVEDIRTALRAGADILQIGTALEKSSDVKKIVSKFAEVVKEEGALKKKGNA
ncbi:MAG: geranylgeranylglyceryl/heptaprenylglyceryl phosphate synthase [Candidatus Micrarchaeia archaeon]|jgi:phosphoglycerol geranylgeranyltransferase